MDKIKQWTLTVSVVSIISGILLSVIPKSSHKNLYKMIISIVLIYAFLQPFAKTNRIDFSIDDFLKENYSVSSNIDKYADSSLVNSAEKAIVELLEEECKKRSLNYIFDCKCLIKSNKIEVDRIIVKSANEIYNKATVVEIVESLGFDKKVIIFEGE